MTDFGLVYVNCKGESFDLMGDSAYYSECPIRDYEWAYDVSIGKVTRFYRDLREVEVPVTVTGPPEERDRMVDVFESDVADRTPGTLVSGGWSIRCFVVASEKPESWASRRSMAFVLRLLLVDESWTRELTVPFSPVRSPSGYKYLDFPIGFPFDLSPNRKAERVENPFRSASEFRLTVYGPAVNPYVMVGGNRYQVNVAVGDGGVLVIDSRARSCLLRSVGGEERNVFGKRLKGGSLSDSYAFKKIPPGVSSVSWDNGFGFDLTIYGERSEPPWT